MSKDKQSIVPNYNASEDSSKVKPFECPTSTKQRGDAAEQKVVPSRPSNPHEVEATILQIRKLVEGVAKPLTERKQPFFQLQFSATTDGSLRLCTSVIMAECKEVAAITIAPRAPEVCIVLSVDEVFRLTGELFDKLRRVMCKG